MQISFVATVIGITIVSTWYLWRRIKEIKEKGWEVYLDEVTFISWLLSALCILWTLFFIWWAGYQVYRIPGDWKANLRDQVQVKPARLYEVCTVESMKRRGKGKAQIVDYEAKIKTAKEKKTACDNRLEELKKGLPAVDGIKGLSLSPIPEGYAVWSCGWSDWSLQADASSIYEGCILRAVKKTSDWCRYTDLHSFEWPLMGRLLSESIASSKGDDYNAIVLELKYPFVMQGGNLYLGVEDGTKGVRAYFKEVIQSETKLVVFNNLIPHARAIFGEITSNRLRSWLTIFWDASYTDFTEFEDKVRADGKYLFTSKKEIEGFWLRRWIDAGRGKFGSDKLILWRFWMWKLAAQLKHLKATAWQTSLIQEMQKTTTLEYKGWYLQRLDAT